ncbi:hypothetical protein FisN_14Hh135 [Fistulifera solaris]|uniref:Trafficking protein particle complex subunit 8 n=1 Tax=Fistulifera solaris TaxID=1519565 RepID=A0A1Z5K8C0_FISSO|nr:hypothetical protein FisN_14Hh135 [Fistulifera solaris]|eukprot:GAX22513.1 hypothetical protein FisN_14Hh135 [Fistulifera solaris]
MTSPSRPLGTLPPPPRVANTTKATTAAPQNEPHHTTVPIPGLSSAPPSANLSSTTSGMTSLFTTSSSLPPPPKLVPTTSSTTSNKSSLPPMTVNNPPNTPTTTTSNTPPPKAKLFKTSPPHPLLARRHRHFPVLILASESAHQLAHKNDLRLVDLLQGLYNHMLAGYQNNQSPPTIPPFRSLTRFLNLTWQDLEIRFVEEFPTMSDTEAADLLSREAQIHATDGNLESELCLLEDQVDNLLLDEPPSLSVTHEERQRQLDQIHKDAFDLTSPLTIPWLQRYRQALDESTEDATHDLFHCPALCLLVATTHEDALATVRALRASQFYLPTAFQNGLMNPQALQHQVVVLHDNVDGAQNWNEQSLQQDLKKEFGVASAVVRINSLSLETARQLATEETSDLWGGGGKLGNCLSMNDRASLRQFLTSLAVEALLPALEHRIATLNAIVSERKKGVRNALKSFWRTGKPKESESTDENAGKGTDAVRYKFDTVENQTRLLADTLFLMADYEQAYGTYRLIKDDLKQDKAHAHYASVQELMALCLYHMDAYGRAREIFSLIENAMWSYSRAAEEERVGGGGRVAAASLSTRLATRLCLVLSATQNVITGRHLEVADLLASASSNENALGAAVLLEQGSAHYFHAELYRKYAFHMLMSGHMYRSAEQNHHAFRCFTSALYIYRGGNWDELHNHIRSALAAQLFSMGRMAIALQLYGKLVGCSEGGRVSTKSQQKYVNNLLEICSDYPKKALAGADRLAAPSHLTGLQRDAIRKEKLDRIVQVVRYTKGATRVLELLNVNLPLIDDHTVVVLAEEASHHRQENVPDFGEAHRGNDELWDELMLCTNAELRAVNEDKAKVDNDVISTALRSIHDPEIRKVITEIDKEHLNRSREERAKRSASYKEMPPIRAQREPYFIEFVMKNPLGIPVDLNDIQLVAKMTSSDTCCTNEDAISITQLVSYNEQPKWTFQSGQEEFLIADFCRLSSGSGEDEKGRWKAAAEAAPFFVVTKTNATLDPEGSKRIALGICPLEKGDLEVLGVRFRLFDAVWVYHQFEIKGRLLQNTRANRANRVRGESMLLRAKVERGMPCLTIELLPAQQSALVGPALEGQIRPWVLRVENIGTAPATNATLKTNIPWIRILHKSTQQHDGVPNSLGPSGTLMTFPLKEGNLHPGESIDVPIEMRIPQSGKHGLYMLFRYELLSDDENERGRFRWLKKMFEVTVYPSISLASSLVPSNRIPSENTLSLEVANNRTDSPDDTDFTVSKVSLVSWNYRLIPFEGQFDESFVELGWQERVASHFRVLPIGDDGSKLSVLSQSDFLKPISQQSKDSDSLVSFLCLESAHAIFEDTLTKHRIALARAEAAHDASNQQPRSIAQIRRANTALTGQESDTEPAELFVDATSVRKLCPRDVDEERVHLIVSWHCKNSAIQGALFVRDLFVRPKMDIKGCPILVTASYPSRLSHDFANGPGTIPFHVHLKNRLTKASVSFEFSLEETQSLNFSGSVSFENKLEADGELSIPLQALVTSTGVYNLQQVRLNVIQKDTASYRFSLQWLVTVTNEKEISSTAE